ncbi:MAG: DUF4300 family protein [Clostridiales bacterium]|nr:DUF4300 family protein [Clostridiales bacterium]MBR3056642.1 DUF4300 family protein [Clostridiales bacterium]
MNKSLNSVLTFVTTLCLILLVTGCGTQNSKTESQGSPYDAVYSNLVDLESQDVLRTALEEAGVQKPYIDALLENIIQYNAATGDILPVQSGFAVFTENAASAYDSTKLERKWKSKYGNLTGRRNCRLTAFEAMGSLISYDTASQVTEPMMLVEINDSSVFQSDSDIRQFTLLFNGIESSENISVSEQAEQINEYWRQTGISFQGNNNISLISIWFNGSDIYDDSDQYILHCGHAAVLIHTKSEGVMLLEKLDYNFPYQLIIFPGEEQALKYIVDFNCAENNDSEIVPIVFVDDRLLKMENGLLVY